MLLQRTQTAELVSVSPPLPILPTSQIIVDEGDCCVVTRQGQIFGRIDAGRWMGSHLPFFAHLQGGPVTLVYVYLRPWGPVKFGTKAAGAMVTGGASIVVQDPMAFVHHVVGTNPGAVDQWLTNAVRPMVVATAGPRLADPANPPSAEELTPAIAQALNPQWAGYGLRFDRLTFFQALRPGEAAGGGISAPTDGRVQLIGKLAGNVDNAVADESIAKWERFGLFVAGDPHAISHYRGDRRGWRWLGRAAGPLIEEVQGWPRAPDGSFDFHFATEEEARNYYGALRQHAMAHAPGLVPQDTRAEDNLNAPSAWSETLWRHQQEVLYLLFDHIEDMEAVARETETIGIHASAQPAQGTESPPLVAFESKSDVHYVGIAKGEDGAVDHVLIVHNDRHRPVPTITDGLPRAEWMKKFEGAGLSFADNILVVMWGRFAGTDIVGATDPVAVISNSLGSEVAVPLSVTHDAMSRVGVPAAYAIRLAPGLFDIHYYELHTDEHGTFTCCAISRQGAPSFMPEVVGNAGGMRFGGLSVEQYAMLSVERDNLIQHQGMQVCFGPQMQALCQKYNVPFNPGGLAARIDEWEQYIANDAAFSAQWATQRGIAMAKLQGHQLNDQQMQQMAQHQSQVQAGIESHNQLLDNIRDAAIALIHQSAGRTPEDVLGMAQQTQLGPNQVLYKAWRILLEPDEYGRMPNVEGVTEPIVRAYYRTMDEDDRRSEGSEERFFKNERDNIYDNNDIEKPGLFNKLFG